MVGDAGEAGPFEAVLAGLADGVASALVFVVGGDVAEGGVQAAGVVVVSGVVEFGSQHVGVGDLFEVGPFGFDVAEQGLDPCLVCGGAGAAEAGCDGAQGPELPGGACSHLGAVVGHDQQDRLVGVAVAVGVAGAVGPSGPSMRSHRPSASSASVNTTSTCVAVSSMPTWVASHLRVTTSKMA